MAALLVLLAKAMKSREPGALLQAAEFTKVRAIIEKVRRNADLSRADAMTRAAALTRAYRWQKASGPPR